MPAAFAIVEATGGASIVACRELFQEYQASVGVSLCFQGFAEEMAALPGAYSRPGGRLYIADRADEPVGCVAVRTIGERQGDNGNPVPGVRFMALALD